jgi:eukaryotic-like serine/threonine-protein kinase
LECLAFAQICERPRRYYAAAARFSADAFTRQPALAADLQREHRYSAACAAALAGCGQGNDAADLPDKERARLRRQGRDWLQDDLAAYRRLLDREPDKARPLVSGKMRHWLADTDFNGVRGPAALAKLPEAERRDWQSLWQEVEELQRRAAGPPEKAATPRP